MYGAEIKTPIGRISWPALVEPKDPPPPQEGQLPGQPRYEVTLLLDKGDPATEAFLGTLEPMVTDMIDVFNERRSAKISVSGNLLKDGDDPYWDKEKYPYYSGHWLLLARNAQATKVYNRLKEEIDAADIKGGHLALLLVTPMITAHGVSYKLGVTQLIKDDGIRYGGGVVNPVSFLDVISDDGQVEVASTPEVVAAEEEPVEEVPAAPKAIAPKVVAKPAAVVTKVTPAPKSFGPPKPVVSRPVAAAPQLAPAAPALASGLRAQMAQNMSKGKKAALDKL